MPAPKGNKHAKGNKGGGRPSLYKREYVRIAARMCALGATNAEMADAFEVGTRTIGEWQTQHVEFAAALKLGKEKADARVERSLYNRAVGYTFDSEKIFHQLGIITRVPTREHVPPDVTAQIFWLKNRRPSEYREKHEVEHSGSEAFMALWQRMAG